MDGASEHDGASRLMDAYMAKRGDLVRFFAARLRSAAAAEDLIQDLYLRLAQLDPATPVDNPSAYLYRLATNLMLDRLRAEQRSSARDAAWLTSQRTDMGGEHIADDPSAEQSVYARQRLSIAAGAIRDLPPKTRRAFALHKLEGKTQSEAARILGVSRKTVEKQISTALQRILARLSDDGKET